jgi:hypothetical protein
MLISPAVEGELRFASDPLPYFKDENAREDTTWAFSFLSAGTSTAEAVPQAPATTPGFEGPRMKGHVRGPAFCVS